MLNIYVLARIDSFSYKVSIYLRIILILEMFKGLLCHHGGCSDMGTFGLILFQVSDWVH